MVLVPIYQNHKKIKVKVLYPFQSVNNNFYLWQLLKCYFNIHDLSIKNSIVFFERVDSYLADKNHDISTLWSLFPNLIPDGKKNYLDEGQG